MTAKLCSVCAFLIPSFWFAACPVYGVAPKKPNVLIVYTDDQRFDTIHALGNTQIHTPNLDALVERGMSFSNAYCQGGNSAAVCVPSRVQFLSGKSTFRTPAPRQPYDGMTLGKAFREAGYKTICISKPGNSFSDAHQHFEVLQHIPHKGATTNQQCADAAIDELKKVREDQSFMMYFAPSMPHDPRTAEERFHSMYDPSKIQLSKNYMAEQPIDIGVLNIRDEKLAAYPRDEKEMKRHLAEYYACITSLDFHLGRVFDLLRERKMLDNTVIVFSSDQGLAVGGRHGLMGKQNLYEHFKSPLIVAGPGVRHGSSNHLTYLFDVFPTVCELAGIPIPEVCEGRSFVPVCKSDSAQPQRDRLFAVYTDTQRMVRNDRWKLLWYPKLNRFQLFDLQNDPDELINLAEQPAQSEVFKAMKHLMRQEQRRFGDPLSPLTEDWTVFQTQPKSSLRGLYALDSANAWASGSGSTILRLSNGGESIHVCPVPSLENAEIRSLHAWNVDQVVFATSGQPAKIMKTSDAGHTWRTVYSSPYEQSFFNGLQFLDDARGIVFGDPIDSHLEILWTEDAGEHWQRLAPEYSPRVATGEAGFAASNSSMLLERDSVRIGLGGGVGAATLLSSSFPSRFESKWNRASISPIAMSATAGIFSLATNGARLVAVGGDYKNESNSEANIAVSDDGGKTWRLPHGSKPRGYRSAVTYSAPAQVWVAVGPNGTDYSRDGEHWNAFSDIGFHALACTRDGTLWASGSDGRVGRIVHSSVP